MQRQPKGRPTGGQFAPSKNPESDLQLDAPDEAPRGEISLESVESIIEIANDLRTSTEKLSAVVADPGFDRLLSEHRTAIRDALDTARREPHKIKTLMERGMALESLLASTDSTVLSPESRSVISKVANVAVETYVVLF